jgi:selenocysteine lyase/cysteine desulfurase
MSQDRRTFLRGLGSGAIGALAVSTSWAASGPDRSLPILDAAKPDPYWAAVRAQFPLQNDPVYLNTGGLGPASQRVLDAVAGTMRQLQEHSETGHALLEPARETMARFLGAQPEEICFVRNATEGNSIVAAGLELSAGDEVIFETHAHPGGSFPWLNQAKQRGVVLRLFEPDAASPEANLARIRALITPRTKVIQVSHITCTTGLVFPVKAIAALAHEHGIWFHLDGAQAVGMIPVDFHAMGCDSYAFSGHKWLGGPHETGMLFIRRDRLEEVKPTGIGAYSGELVQLPGAINLFGAAVRHEYGTRNAGLIAGLAEAAQLQEEIGRDRIAAHGRELSLQLHQGLAGIDGISLLTPRHKELFASMTTIRHSRAGAHKLFGYLLEKHRLRCRPVTEQGLEAVRISTHVFTSRTDCERVVTAVHAAANAL